ncbi:MAG: DNA-binding response OmpR family regulator [Lentimonas sp.]|jgi:DNA-binding response OmpR family regulator
MSAKILLAEDDTSLGFVISDHLKSLGYKVTLCCDGVEAMIKFSQEAYHLGIFDVMMPKKDGFTLAKEIRKVNKEFPILFLTAKSMTEDKVEGFKAGGDDYLTKPFNFDEFEMRILALLKRVNIIPFEENKLSFQLGNFAFDSEQHTIVRGGVTKSLTKKENQILKMLAKYQNQVVARDVVLNAVWGQDDYFVGRSLDVFITKLRKYLVDDQSVQILNIHGIGFKLECNQENEE